MGRATEEDVQHGRALALGAGLAALTATGLHAEDWPQWMGPDRLGVWRETGIVERFPADGLRVTWSVPIGNGFAAPAVTGGRVFVTDWEEDPESRTVDGTERVLALDEETGESCGPTPGARPTERSCCRMRAGPMPRRRSTRIAYTCWAPPGGSGVSTSRPARSSGTATTSAEYDAGMPETGTSSAPLVDGEQLIAVVGGEPDALVVSFDKRTGRELWRALGVTGGSRAAPVIYEAGGVRQLIIWHPSALVSLDPATGEVYWEQPWDAGGMNVVTPVRSGNYLLVSNFYVGSLMMRLGTDRPAATMLWQGSSRSELPHETDGLHSVITPRRSSATTCTASAATASCGGSTRARASGCG